MKHTLTNFKDNDVHSVGHYTTLEDAKTAKRNFLKMWTVGEIIKHKIRSIIN